MALALVWCLAGCGGGSGVASTPEGTVKALLAAVQASDAQAIAALYDYETAARQQNEDWDDIPSGQRGLIVKKLIEERAQKLQPALPQMQQMLGGAEVGEVRVSDAQATVSLKNVSGVILQLAQIKEKWYLSSL